MRSEDNADGHSRNAEYSRNRGLWEFREFWGRRGTPRHRYFLAECLADLHATTNAKYTDFQNVA
jgi:hypothetical protein